MPHQTLCSRCGEYKPCESFKVVGPTEHPLCEAGAIFEVCSQRCLNETYKENADRYGVFKIQEYRY